MHHQILWKGVMQISFCYHFPFIFRIFLNMLTMWVGNADELFQVLCDCKIFISSLFYKIFFLVCRNTNLNLTSLKNVEEYNQSYVIVMLSGTDVGRTDQDLWKIKSQCKLDKELWKTGHHSKLIVTTDAN